jgi:hypothetical protein
MHCSKWHRNAIILSASCWSCNGPSKRKAFAAFTSITEVREFNGDAFNVGQN